MSLAFAFRAGPGAVRRAAWIHRSATSYTRCLSPRCLRSVLSFMETVATAFGVRAGEFLGERDRIADLTQPVRIALVAENEANECFERAGQE